MQSAALLHKRRQAREEFRFFAGLIAAPGNLVAGVPMPAGAMLYAARSTALVATTKVLTVNATGGALVLERFLPVSAAETPRALGYAREDLVLFKAAGLTGTLRVYVRNGVGKLFKIAEG